VPLVPIDADLVKRHIRDIPDWPEPGVLFRDITPLVGDATVFRSTIETIVEHVRGSRVDRVLGVEARGFIFAAPVAHALGAGFVPVRKAGKLPYEIEQEEYELEYGTDLLEIHTDSITAGERVLVVDDVLATGGTASATARLVRRLGGEVVALAFVVELGFLDGRAKLDGEEIISLATYD
jgi:adenine phosphoribosyltransferase